MGSSGTPKRTYHHGDLRNALISAAAELAAQGGPGSVSIRAAARLVGVTPTAAYRHFAGHEELLVAAKDRAVEELTNAMDKELSVRPRSDDPVNYALGSLAALGRGYLAFARAQPGLFATVFSAEFSDKGALVAGGEDQVIEGPYELLLSALDELVEVGYLSPARRPLAEFAAWSMVHGMAVLLAGPLRDVEEEVREQAVVRSMLILGHGLSGDGLTPEQEQVISGEMTAAVSG
jgi:AcrR family transcriptional regulator